MEPLVNRICHEVMKFDDLFLFFWEGEISSYHLFIQFMYITKFSRKRNKTEP